MNRSRTVEFLKGAISTTLLQFIITVAGFITPRIILTMYGSEINGVVSSLTQFINYFTLVEAGLGGAAIYALYEPLAVSNYKKANSILAATKKMYEKSGYLFLVLVFVLALIFPIFIDIKTLKIWEVFLLTLIIGMTGVLDFFTLSKYRVILTADQKVYVISIASSVYYILFTIIFMTISRLSVSIVILRLIALSAILVRSVILYLYCRKTYSWLSFKETPNYAAMKSKNDVLFQQICGMVQTGMPIILATFILRDLKIVSVFSIYNMVMGGINGILGVFSTSLASGFGNLIISNDKKLLKNTYNEFESVYMILITIVYSTAMFLILPFVGLYTNKITDINYIIPIFACLSVWNGVLYNVKTPLSMLVVSAGMYRETRIQNAISATIIVIAGIPLTILLGLNGIMIASILSNIYRTISFLFFVHKIIIKDSPKDSFFRILRVLLLITLAMIFTFQLRLEVYSVYNWIMLGIIIFFITSLIVIIFMGIFDKINIHNLIKRLTRVLKNR